MFGLWSALNSVDGLTVSLVVISLIIALFFEMINGFHDTANAVAMIIYTNSMKARNSVVMSGIMNFIGVMLGGIGVAYAVVHLLPVDILITSNRGSVLVMIFSLLIAAVIWNFGTWYVGLPVSSSHSLIGSIIGVSAAFGVMHGFSLNDSINWDAVWKVLIPLAIAPIVGFILGYILMKLAREVIKSPKYYKTPVENEDGKVKKPNFWMRLGIIFTGVGVSFAHGSNDGQKGMGLIMIILIGLLPAYFALNMDLNQYKIKEVSQSATNLATFYKENNASMAKLIADKKVTSALKTDSGKNSECSINRVYETTNFIATKLNNINSYAQMNEKDKWQVHNAILCSDNFFSQVEKGYASSDKDKSDFIKKERTTMVSSVEYVPYWVMIAVALALSIGTMIGYKRIVVTIGEKIGSQPINHMQGAVAQAMAMITILLANFAHAPVSTTHIVSSSVAGTMQAEHEDGLQKNTIKTILLSWLFTLPITAIIGALIYIALSYIVL